MSNEWQEYLKENCASHLRRDLESQNPVRHSGAIRRIARVRPQFKGMSIDQVREKARHTDLLDTVAFEHGYDEWRDVGARRARDEATAQATGPAKPSLLHDAIDALRELQDEIHARQRAHDCPGFDCATCTPSAGLFRAANILERYEAEREDAERVSPEVLAVTIEDDRRALSLIESVLHAVAVTPAAVAQDADWTRSQAKGLLRQIRGTKAVATPEPATISPGSVHPSHQTRSSGASSFDEICIKCGATDSRGSTSLQRHCPETGAEPPNCERCESRHWRWDFHRAEPVWIGLLMQEGMGGEPVAFRTTAASEREAQKKLAEHVLEVCPEVLDDSEMAEIQAFYDEGSLTAVLDYVTQNFQIFSSWQTRKAD